MKNKNAVLNFRNGYVAVLLLGTFLFSLGSGAAGTYAQVGVTVIDDFEDNNVADWVFFGGDIAGGGGGTADDRAQEGAYYFSTGWGSGGESNGFFGGAFKNFDDASQPALPADPWFNVYVYNQSNATSEGYTLEITLREDVAGDGWDGAGSSDESFRLDTTYTSADYTDAWTLVSAPLSSFNLVDGSGDGSFTGALDEIILVVAGVPNAADGTTVEVDFDYIVFSDGGPIEAPEPPAPELSVIDDFEDNDVADWGFFGGDIAGGGGGTGDDRPQEGAYYFSTGWGSGGESNGFFGGAFKNFDDASQPAVPADPWFNVYVYNQSNATSEGYTLEITLREDNAGDGWDGFGSTDESFRLNTTYTSADYTDAWTLVSAPLSSFNLVDGSGDGSFTAALDEIVLVVAGVPNAADGTTVEVDFDYIVFSDGGPIDAPEPPADPTTLPLDFETGEPVGWVTYFGNDVTVTTTFPVIGDADAMARPDQAGDNQVVQVVYDASLGFGGSGLALSVEGAGGAQDWSSFDGVSFWMYGSNTGTTFQFDLQDNRSDANTDTAERWDVVVTDDFTGWQLVELAFADFTRALDFQPVGAPDDGLGLTEVWGFALQLDGGAGTLILDDIDLYNSSEPPAPELSVIDDFEDNDVADWVFFGGDIAGGGGGTADDRAQEGTYYFSTGWGSGGESNGFFGGAFKNFDDASQPAVPADPWFNVYVYNQSNATSEGYTLEITLREDVAGDGWDGAGSSDESFRLDTTYTSADYTDAWTLVSAPLSSFNLVDGSGDGSFTGALDEIILVVAGVPNAADGTTVEVDFDYLVFSDGGPIDAPEPPVEPSDIIDDFEEELASSVDPEGISLGFFTFSDNGSTSAISRTQSLPAPVPGEITGNHVLSYTSDVSAFAGFIHIFGDENLENFAPQDWSAFEGIKFWMYGQNSGTDLFVDIVDNRNPGSEVDDGERFSVALVDDFSGWQEIELPFSSFVRKDIGNGAPNDGLGLTQMHGWAFGSLATNGPVTLFLDDVSLYGEAVIPDLAVTFSTNSYSIEEGATGQITVKLNRAMSGEDPAQVSVDYFTEQAGAIPNQEYIPPVGTLTFVNGGLAEQSFSLSTIDDSKWEGNERIILRLNNFVDVAPGFATQASAFITENDTFDEDLIDDFEQGAYMWEGNSLIATKVITSGGPDAIPGQDPFETVLNVAPAAGDTEFGTDFPDAEDWSDGLGLKLWYYGQNTGESVNIEIQDNRAPDPGPTGWNMVWSDEFDDPAGTPPNPANWTHEIGDVTPDGKNGWGNDERQYYTDSTDNAAMDGNGNLVITVQEDTSGRECYYGTCEYTSARLISWRKAEFAYGKIESRIQVPQGQGIWPAFWSLGTNIDQVSWPQSGEIDFMEFVGRVPNEIFGTIHGPGYQGGASYGGTYNFGEPVYNDFHTFTVEWEPDLIVWYVDGVEYHRATPADVAPNEWVFNHEFFLLLNVAIGGNFGGAIDPNIPLPQSMKVDYIRVYQGPDTAERFDAQFVDNFTGWQEVSVPFEDFSRSATQPAGAPDDGLTLTGVRGYAFTVPNATGDIMIDQVRLDMVPPPSSMIVTNLNDSGEGSLRDAVDSVAAGGIVTFDSSLEGGTITLTSGEIAINSDLTIDASPLGSITVNGNNSSRGFSIAASTTVSLTNMVVENGFTASRGGGIYNLGTLNLDYVTVSNNQVSDTVGTNFDNGGGGIYNGEGATLNMTRSSVVGNSTGNQPGGGIYGFFFSIINISESTISGNVSGDVAGGLRTLGDVTIVNTTISDNTSSAWHGGAAFLTDGTVQISNSTIADNNSPDGTAGGLMIATFGNAVTVNVQNTIIADNGSLNCQIEGSSTVAVFNSLGNNLFTDLSCTAVESDLQVGSGGSGLAALANNGGTTQTYALLPSSPAIDAAEGSACPATDQRGVVRPQGAACDIGAFELEPAVADEWIFNNNTGSYVDGSSTQIQSNGTGSDWSARFWRANEESIDSGNKVTFDFYVDAIGTKSHLSLVKTGGDFERLSLLDNGNGLQVQFYRPNQAQPFVYRTLLSTAEFQADTWYEVSIAVDDVNGFVIEVEERDNPAVSGMYRDSTGLLSAGNRWEFLGFLRENSVFVDNYKVQPDEWTFANNAGTYVSNSESAIQVDGSGTDFSSRFWRKDGGTIENGHKVSFDFYVDVIGTKSHLSLVNADGDFERLSLLDNGNGLQVQFYRPNQAQPFVYRTLLSTAEFQANTWYEVSIAVDDVNGFVIEVEERDNPAVSGMYRDSTGLLSAGNQWEFLGFLRENSVFVDNYAVRPDEWVFTNNAGSYVSGSDSQIQVDGTGVDFNARFSRKDGSVLENGHQISFDFYVDTIGTKSHLSLVKAGGDFERLALLDNGNGLQVQFYRPNQAQPFVYQTLLSAAEFQANTWYEASITLYDFEGFLIEVEEQGNPSISGSYQDTTGLLSIESQWEFLGFLRQDSIFIDNYLEVVMP